MKESVKEALLVAEMRAGVAKKYAAMFPQFVHRSDEKYQDVNWQYENEGLKSVRPVETKVEK